MTHRFSYNIPSVLCMWPLDLLDDKFTCHLRKDLSIWLAEKWDKPQLYAILKQELSNIDLQSTSQRLARFARLDAILCYPEGQVLENDNQEAWLFSVRAIEANRILIERLGNLKRQDMHPFNVTIDFHHSTMEYREYEWQSLGLLYALGTELKMRQGKALRAFFILLEQEDSLRSLIQYLISIFVSKEYEFDKGQLVAELLDLLSSTYSQKTWSLIIDSYPHFETFLFETLISFGNASAAVVIVSMQVAISLIRDHIISNSCRTEHLILSIFQGSFPLSSKQDRANRAKLFNLFNETKWEFIWLLVGKYLGEMKDSLLDFSARSYIRDFLCTLLHVDRETIDIRSLIPYQNCILALMEAHLGSLTQPHPHFPHNHFCEDWPLTCENLLSLWSLIRQESFTRSDFLEIFECFVKIVFHRGHFPFTTLSLISYKNRDEHMIDASLENSLHKIFDEVMEAAESRLGILPRLALQFVKVADNSLIPLSVIIERWSDELLRMLLHGPLRNERKDDVIIMSLAHQARIEDPIQLELLKDSSVRALIISLLNSDRYDHPKTLFCRVLDLLESSEMNPDRACHMNTSTHRIRLRAYQSLLILLPRMLSNSSKVSESIDSPTAYGSSMSVQEILDRLFYLLSRESLLSLRYYIEWCIIYAIYNDPDMMDRMVLNRLRNYNQRPAMICSLLTVIIHLLPDEADIIPNSESSRLLANSLDHILPWLISGHHNIRIYAAACFKRLYCLLEKSINSQPIEASVPCLHSIRFFIEQNVDLQKLLIKHEQNFLFHAFNPIHDLTLENVFYTLPSMSGVAEDEWILPYTFQLIDNMRRDQMPKSTIVKQDSPFFSSKCPLKNIKSHDQTITTPVEISIAPIQPSIYVADSVTDGIVQNQCNYQRKRLPWEQLMLQADIFISRTMEKERQRNNIIVLASFIDKLPNLAGLARTCEIFNAQKLLLSNLRLIHDTLFRSISVTAEKWIPIEELKEIDVPKALSHWKYQGYQIIGVEQTAHSISLEQFQFAEKCVILLGQEKEGIPINILPYLDVCVEIPQSGIIR